MTARVVWVAACLLAAGSLGSANELSEAQIEGHDLARQLRELKPETNSLLTGAVRIRERKRKRKEIPVRFETVVTATNWTTIYTTTGTNLNERESLVVIHAQNQPNRYRLEKGNISKSTTNNSTTLTGEDAMIPFAGSDFWLADMGLEFLHWPEQQVLKKELRKGQSCYVLESKKKPGATKGYVRVVSWIDIDTGGIVHADAYDAKRRLLKEFDPQKLKKVNGQWQLREMEMYNVQTRSLTRIEFDLDKD